MRINHLGNNMEENNISKFKKKFFGTLEKEDMILTGSLAQFELTFISFVSFLKFLIPLLIVFGCSGSLLLCTRFSSGAGGHSL